MLGSITDFVPKHVKQYSKVAEVIKNAVTGYYNEVRNGEFPTEAQSFTMDETIH